MRYITILSGLLFVLAGFLTLFNDAAKENDNVPLMAVMFICTGCIIGAIGVNNQHQNKNQ